MNESFGVDLPLVIPAETGIGRLQMVVVVDVLYLYHSWEFHVVHFLAGQQVQIFYLPHPLHQIAALLNTLRVGSDGLQHRPLYVRVLLLLLEQALQFLSLL